MQTAKTTGDVIAYEGTEPRWGIFTKIAFRFAFAYSLIYFLPFPITAIPKVGEVISDAWDSATFRLARPVGELIGLTVINQPTGSGDTALAFVTVFISLALAVLITLVWSVVDRRRPHYRVLLEVLTIYVRFALASIMMSYGAAKVWKSQFPLPSPARLMEPLGAMSPMGLLWTFMGHSTAYTVFGGLSEMLGGALLFVRRTALLGALVTAGVMTNVVMLNVAYDVPVKQFSMHLLAFALLVAAPHAVRLLRFFVLGTAVAGAPAPGPRRLRVALAIIGLAAAAALTYKQIDRARANYAAWGDGAPRSPIEGIYEVEELVVDGAVVPPLLTETQRLRRIALGKSVFTILTVGDTYERWMLKTEDNVKLTLSERNGPPTSYEMTFTPQPDGRIVLAGKLRDKELRATVRKIDLTTVQLNSRPFTWIQETPYNR